MNGGMEECPECDTKVTQPKCPKCGRRVLDRKWWDLTEEEKSILLPYVENARRKRGQGPMHSMALMELSTFAYHFNLNERQWSMEALSKTGCLALILFLGTVAGAVLVITSL